jgi:hypothetical protein
MFASDLAEAHAVELAAMPFLERFTPSRAWPNPQFDVHDCDLWWQWEKYDRPAGVEVKYDRLALTTGNIAIEHRSIGKSSCELRVCRLPFQEYVLADWDGRPAESYT